LSQDGQIVASKAHQHPPSADALAAELLQAMRRPALGAGRARRPNRLYLDTAEQVALLSPVLEALDIACVYRPALAMADEVMAAMETDLGAYAPLPGLVVSSAGSPGQLGQ